MLNIFAILEGLISSVPEALALYHRIVPLISPNADIPEEKVAEINAVVPEVHAAVNVAHQALAILIAAHAPAPLPVPAPANEDPPPAPAAA